MYVYSGVLSLSGDRGADKMAMCGDKSVLKCTSTAATKTKKWIEK